jgi:DAK2 domain fusion protein YloV
MVLGNLSAGDLAKALFSFASALNVHREEINRLNVYPVPDGDTGTNMALTLDAVVAELTVGGLAGAGATGQVTDLGGSDASPALGGGQPGWEEVAKAMSNGSLMGARGNSGVILSQVLRGFAAVAGELARTGSGLGAAELARALRQASDDAYRAVSNPVEGTMLTVARAAALGAERALAEQAGGGLGASDGPAALVGSAGGQPRAALVAVLEAARASAAEALAGTTEQLPALKAAGVVDAGGAGLLLLYDALLHCADGRPLPLLPENAPQVRTGSRARSQASETTDLRYEVMFLLEAPDEAMPAFKEVWAGTGGSIAIVGGDGLYNCHIHTDDVGAAIEAAIEIGRPRHIRVTDLAEQVEEERWVRESVAAGPQAPEDEGLRRPVETAVVAVSSGEGVKRIFRSLGARQLVAAGRSANPSVRELLEAISRAPAEGVIVLPNNPNVVPVAEQAVANSVKKVRVVPTGGIAEGFAALLAYDPEADVDTNADAMADAAARVLPGEVAQASRDAGTGGRSVRAGDWLGLSRQEVKVAVPAEAGPAAAAIALLGVLVKERPGCDIITLIEGEGATPASTRQVVEWVSDELPGVETEVHHGGQPLYAYVLSVE